jgi:HAD superfamily hydrolase (TIGR01509 family)
MSKAALAMLRARRHRLRLVIFDCDGVLIDSEPIADRVMAEELTAIGWPMTAAENHAQFLGMDVGQVAAAAAARLGRPMSAGWLDRLADRLVAAMAQEAPLVAGAAEALRGVSALGLPWRVASNSSHAEMAAKFGRNGLAEQVAGRLHSFHDVPRGKPAPDIYLAAAAAEGVSPANCVVIEDSLTGVRAAVSAGMDCLGFSPSGDGARLAAVGAAPFHSMLEVPDLLRAALEAVA